MGVPCRLAVLSGRSTIPSQASGAKEQKWKDLFLSEKKRAASLLARERQLEREQSRLAQQQSKGAWFAQEGSCEVTDVIVCPVLPVVCLQPQWVGVGANHLPSW